MNSMCATADVGDDGDVRRGNFRQRGDLARMIHPDLPNRDFILRRRVQNRVRQTDMIVEISFRLRDAKARDRARPRQNPSCSSCRCCR